MIDLAFDTECYECSTDEFRIAIRTFSTNLSFLTINILSLNCRFSEFCTFLQRTHMNFSFIVLTETWLSEAQSY